MEGGLDLKTERARDAQRYLVQAQRAAMAARQAPSLAEAEALIGVSREWVDRASVAMAEVLLAELRDNAANEANPSPPSSGGPTGSARGQRAR
jgi:hypothetical protein